MLQAGRTPDTGCATPGCELLRSVLSRFRDHEDIGSAGLYRLGELLSSMFR
jgi:hypothetical protein